jgi:hypothetical protein
VTTTVDSHEGEVSAALDSSSGAAVLENIVLERGLFEVFVSGPFKRFSPSLVAEPVL